MMLITLENIERDEILNELFFLDPLDTDRPVYIHCDKVMNRLKFLQPWVEGEIIAPIKCMSNTNRIYVFLLYI